MFIPIIGTMFILMFIGICMPFIMPMLNEKVWSTGELPAMTMPLEREAERSETLEKCDDPALSPTLSPSSLRACPPGLNTPRPPC